MHVATKKSRKDSELAEVATLGGGCFWCLEAVFAKVKGVTKVISGYSGGQLANPTYEQVSTGTTGHAEVVQLTFNPNVVSFREILQIFFAMHDPTTVNRQGADVGTQYRSLILYHSSEQKATANKLIKELNNADIFGKPFVTQVESFKAFYKAEEHHKDYYKRHSDQPYCKLVIGPKIDELHKLYLEKLKK